jgi:hypothetical protein
MQTSVDFKAKVEREDIFKPSPEYASLHKASNDKGIRVVSSAT